MKNKLQDLAYTFIVLILILIAIYQDQRIKEYREEELLIQGGDIYKSELLDSINLLNINIGRYEAALNHLKYEDSITANKFESILYSME
jgi:uncharacterized membrane protein YiaA